MDDLPFVRQAKSEWVEQVNRELKGGKTYDLLKQDLGDNLQVEPFYHPDDQVHRSHPISLKPNQSWKMLDVFNHYPDSQAIDSAKGYDIRDILINYNYDLPTKFTQKLFELPVDLSLHLHFRTLPNELNEVAKNANLKSISGSQIDLLQRQELIQWNRRMPSPVSVIFADPGPEEKATRQLLTTMTQLVDWFALVDPSDLNAGIIINMPTGHSVLQEIAKIRALKILIFNLWHAYDLFEYPFPHIRSCIQPVLNLDPHLNLIALTSQSISAILGGVDHLAPEIPSGAEPVRLRNNVRSLHHILRLEGYLDHVIDPLAGSYYLDEVARLMAMNSWKMLQKARGGQGASR